MKQQGVDAAAASGLEQQTEPVRTKLGSGAYYWKVIVAELQQWTFLCVQVMDRHQTLAVITKAPRGPNIIHTNVG